MYHGFLNFSSVPLVGGIGSLVALFIIWELGWKGYGLWVAARKNQPIWFIAILILNTLGILPIVYIYFFSKGKAATVKAESQPKDDKSDK